MTVHGPTVAAAAARAATALVLLFAVSAAPAACGSSGDSDVQADSAVAGANPGDDAAVYLELDNGGPGDDALVGASCDCAGDTSLHITEDRDGILLMQPAEEIVVPAGSNVELHPGGPHVMLEDLDAPLQAGETISLTLEFREGNPIELDVTVLPLDELAERVPEG